MASEKEGQNTIKEIKKNQYTDKKVEKMSCVT